MFLRRDITSTRLLMINALLFVLLGCAASAMMLLEDASVKTVVLLAITIWAFCRAYYFCFYVIEHYIDPSFRFAGLMSALRFVLGRYRADNDTDGEDTD